MAEFIITSYFEDSSGPVTGLSPTIRIWEVTTTGENLVVGAPCGSPGGADGIMVEMDDCGSPASERDGFYRYTFATYDPAKSYVVRVDGGAGLAVADRYQPGRIQPADNVQSFVNGVWDEPRADHLIVGSTGEAVSLDRADLTTILTTSLPAIFSLLDLVRKYDTNRTEIDPVTKTLTVYDDDCTTVLRVFELYDSTGTLSVTDVCERVPKASVVGIGATTDGQAVCP